MQNYVSLFFCCIFAKIQINMGLLETARNAWTTIKNETIRRANTATRVGNAGLAIIDYVESLDTTFSGDLALKMQYKGDYDVVMYAHYLVNDVYSWRGGLYLVHTPFTTSPVSPPEDFHDPVDTNYWTKLTKIYAITTQGALDSFRPQSGFAIVTMNSSIDHEIRNIFGTDNKVEIHAYTVAGTASDSGNCYQDGVSAISGITYRRSYNILTGWTNFVALATDISRKIDFIDWYDLGNVYSVNKGDIIRVTNNNHYKWYIVIQDYIGSQSNVDFTDSSYYFDITGHTHDWVNITGKPSTFTPSAHNHLNDTLKPNVVEYQSGVTPPTNVGSQYYDDTYKVLSTVLGNDVVLQNGLEMYVRVVNKTGVQLNDGQVVYISGAQGNRPTATLAIATSEQASYVIGVCTENIANNQEGFVTVFGTVNGYNTSSFTDGAKLYLSATVAGGLTMTRPVAPNHGVIVGIALNSTNNGAIFVNPNAGFELSELHDVDTTKTKSIPLDADYFLMQDTADSNIWKKVLKAKTNEVSIGSTAPTNNEVLWVDTSSVINTSFTASTSATISPDFLSDKAKFTSNYAGGNTVAISGYTNLPAYDCEKILIIKNTNGSDRIFVPTTTQQILGGITYNWILYNTSTITVPTGKYLEISYEFNFTSSTTCDVTILWVVQG